MKLLIVNIIALSLSLASGLPAALADELILTPTQFAAKGYQPVAQRSSRLDAHEVTAPTSFAPHSLEWPSPFLDTRHTIGNVMTQFQNYGGGAYYHGGDDVRVQAREWVIAPVSGRLEAGHYGYSMKPDGSSQKYWYAWPQRGEAMYFEVAIVTEDGYRFELHHIDRATLPAEIVAALNSGKGTVKAGQRVGRVVTWPNADTDDSLYHHVHYNIIAADGTKLNPEHYSRPIPDTIAPEVSEIYAVDARSRAISFNAGIFAAVPAEFVVVASDRLGENIYKHTPSYSRLVFENGAQTVWDFRETLTGADGKFPPLWSFLREELRLSNGKRLYTRGNYSQREFLLRLRVPAGARGKFTIEVGDSAGNVTVRTGEIL